MKVVRFGKLFRSDPQKSCPFWKTEFGCKVTKNSQTDNFLFLKFYKNYLSFDITPFSIFPPTDSSCPGLMLHLQTELPITQCVTDFLDTMSGHRRNAEVILKDGQNLLRGKPMIFFVRIRHTEMLGNHFCQRVDSLKTFVLLNERSNFLVGEPITGTVARLATAMTRDKLRDYQKFRAFFLVFRIIFCIFATKYYLSN
jgi:hypothetical protein